MNHKNVIPSVDNRENREYMLTVLIYHSSMSFKTNTISPDHIFNMFFL